MDQQECLNFKDKNSSLFLDGNQKGNLEPLAGTQIRFESENLSRSSAQEIQLQSFENKILDEDNVSPTRPLDKSKENNEFDKILFDREVVGTDRPLSPVRKLQRLASPEEELDFQFGIAPKPASYKLNRPSDFSLETTNLSAIPSNGHPKSFNGNQQEKSVDNQKCENDIGPNLRAESLEESPRTGKNNRNCRSKDHREELGPQIFQQTNDQNGDSFGINTIIFENDHLPIQNSRECGSNLDSTGRHGKSNSRIPSKKPRIKKPFPDVINNTNSSKNVRIKSNPLVQAVNPIFNNDISMISDAKLISVQNSRALNTIRIHERANSEHQQSLVDINGTPKERIGVFNEHDENNHKLGCSINDAKSVTPRRLSPEILQPLPASNFDYPLIIESGSPRQNDGKKQMFSQCNIATTRECKDCQGEYFSPDLKHQKHIKNKILDISQIPSKELSRPESRRNNGRQITRPISSVQKQQTNKTILASSIFDKKAQIANNDQHTSGCKKIEITPSASTSVAACQKIFESYNIFVDLAKECEDKNEIIEKQKTEIRQMKNLDNFSRERIKQLESEITVFKQRSEKLTWIYKKYKSQIDKTFSFQTPIRERGKDAIERFSLVDSLPRSLILEVDELKERIQLATLKLNGLREKLNTVAKEVDESNRNLAEKTAGLNEDNKASMREIQCLNEKNKKLQDSVVELERDKKFLSKIIEHYKAHIQELEALNIINCERFRKLDLHEQEALLEQIDKEKRLQDKIKSISNDNAILTDDLSREKMKTKKLKEDLETFQKNHYETFELIKEAPNEVLLKLTREDTVFSKIIKVGNSIQAKMDQAVGSMESKIGELSATITKLKGDFCSSLENSWQKEENKDILLGPIMSTFKELKENLNLLHLDQEAQERLYIAISGLQQTNEMLLNNNSILEKEKIQIRIEFNELASKLKRSEEDLRNKTADLDARIAVPKEDPLLISKVMLLEEEKRKMAAILESVKQEISESNEKWTKACDLKEQRILQQKKKILDSEAQIQNFENEKVQYKIRIEEENRQICQELTKKAESSKATIKLKLETEVKNLEQKIREKITELHYTKTNLEKAKVESIKANEECQKLRTESESIRQTCLELQKELASFKEQFSRQAAQIQVLEVNSLEIQASDGLLSKLGSVLKDVSELRLMLQAVKKDNSQIINLFSLDRKAIEDHLHFLLVKQSNEARAIEDLSLQENLAILEASFTDPSFEAGERLDCQIFKESKKAFDVAEDLAPTAYVELFEEKSQGFIDNSSNADLQSQEISFFNISTPQLTEPKRPSFCAADEELDQVRYLHSKKTMDTPNLLTENHQVHSINNSPQKERVELSFNNSTDGEFSRSKSDSSPLTDIEPIIKILHSVTRQDELSQEYQKTRKLKESSSCKTASPLALKSQEITHCSLKHSLQSTEIAPKTSSQQFHGAVLEDGPAVKRQKSRGKVLRSMSENSRQRQSGPSRLSKSSLRSQIGQEINKDSSVQNCKTDITFEVGHLMNSPNQHNQRTESNGSNVKQRRQDLSICNFMGVDRCLGVKLNSTSKNGQISGGMIAQALGIQDSRRSRHEKKYGNN